MKRIVIALAALLASVPAFAQEPPKKDDKYRPEAPQGGKEEKDLTPEEALKILKEVKDLMDVSEELLNSSSMGKALEAEEKILERVRELLKDEGKVDPKDSQRKVLEKIEKLMKKSEGNQQGAVDKMADVIRRVKAQQQGQGQPQDGPPQQRQPQDGQPQSAQQPSNPATSPYDPNRTGEPINKFRSSGDRTGRWGDLPGRVREAMLSGKRDLDDFPPEYQQFLKEYFRALNDSSVNK
jgi:hypothetical protein